MGRLRNGPKAPEHLGAQTDQRRQGDSVGVKRWAREEVKMNPKLILCSAEMNVELEDLMKNTLKDV